MGSGYLMVNRERRAILSAEKVRSTLRAEDRGVLGLGLNREAVDKSRITLKTQASEIAPG